MMQTAVFFDKPKPDYNCKGCAFYQEIVTVLSDEAHGKPQSREVHEIQCGASCRDMEDDCLKIEALIEKHFSKEAAENLDTFVLA